MLSIKDNDLLTRVTGDAPMGQMMRRYWMPACLSEEVAEPDGAPVRMKLLGERLVVFRDAAGRVGVVDERCPHRLASLALGRNEDGGLRCIYHGWKFDVCGNCVDMPTEPPDYGYRDRINLKAYPTREAGGMVWTYTGPPELEPPFPEYDWMKLPPDQRAVFKVGERANYLQAVEGAIDSAHSWFLHQGVIWDWKKRASLSIDTSPKLETEDTSYGMRYAAIRKTVQDPDKQKYVRVTLFLVPFTAVHSAAARKEFAGAYPDFRAHGRREHHVLRNLLQPGRLAGQHRRDDEEASRGPRRGSRSQLLQARDHRQLVQPGSCRDEKRKLHGHRGLHESGHGLPGDDGPDRRPLTGTPRDVRHRDHLHAPSHAGSAARLPAGEDADGHRRDNSVRAASAANRRSSRSSSPGRRWALTRASIRR